MAEQSAYITNLITTLTPLGPVTAKRMFGGYGVFLDGTMFALVSKNEELFFKADAVSRDAFIARGSKTHGKMPYYAAPTDALGGWAEMGPWAQGAVDAAKRGAK